MKKKKKKGRTHIRWMVRRDMDSVLEIERSMGEDAWDEADFLKALRQRNCIGMIVGDTYGMDDLSDVRGFMVYELYQRRINVIRLVVDPNLRHMGYGTSLIEKLKFKLSTERRPNVEIMLRETNLDGQIFLKNRGFQCVQIIRAAFDDSWEDALLMRYSVLGDYACQGWNNRISALPSS